MIFWDKIAGISDDKQFHDRSLEAYRFQYHNNSVYRAFSHALQRTPANVESTGDIPFLPIRFFKSHKVYASGSEPQKIWLSSGTSGMERSRHYVADLSLYISSLTEGFRMFYGNPAGYRIFALTPSPDDAPDSSLVFMLQTLMSGHEGFLPPGELRKKIASATESTKKTILVGTTYALLDFIEEEPMHLPGLIVVETGGMKGRRKEMIREEVHKRLSGGFRVPSIHSEYGMAELLSQAWSYEKGLYRCPPWMKIFLRDVTDPLSPIKPGDRGGINVIDLANIFSCPFIATQDLGKINADGTFEVLGRYDDAEVRGCSLMNSE